MRGFLLALLLLASVPPSARADFVDGLQAYDAGDYQRAIAEWKPLAEAGDEDALLALAGLYRQGLGGAPGLAPGLTPDFAPDLAKAARLYRRAAEQGAAIAQLNLGDLYARGIGVERDLVQASMWLQLAARQAHRWAARRLEQIHPAMTASEVAEARRRADAWADTWADAWRPATRSDR
jgi:TPR repeat protein